jgi:tetratricopeptide (TPR) repeat protein
MFCNGMNRTTKLKILYIVAQVAIVGVSLWTIWASEKHPLVIAGVVVALLIPGRICGHYWRDFFRGRNLMTHERFAEAEPLFVAFLAKVDEKPWLKKLINLSWGMYTRDVEVMTLNNLGAIKIGQGHFQEAKEFLDRAIAMDGLAPLPYYNLALIAAVDGKKDLAEELFRHSRERGFTGSSVDELIRQASELLARVEGHVKADQNSGGTGG